MGFCYFNNAAVAARAAQVGAGSSTAAVAEPQTDGGTTTATLCAHVMLSMCRQTEQGGLRWHCAWLRVVYAMPACMCFCSLVTTRESQSTCRHA
jgi:hypothetical protein